MREPSSDPDASCPPRRQLAKEGVNPMDTLDQMVGERTWTFGAPYASSWLLFIASLMHEERETGSLAFPYHIDLES